MITDRRSILTGLALVAATPAALSLTSRSASAAMVPPGGASTASQFYMGVIGRAELSLATSQIAVGKASRADAHEFAGFELGEAITVNMILKDLGTKSPPMDAEAMSALNGIKGAADGKAFDTAYIAFQLANHEYLRDLADGYLHNTAGATDMEEKQGRRLASLMLGVFKEHVAICKRISTELKA